MADFKQTDDLKKDKQKPEFWFNEIAQAGTRESIWHKEAEYVSTVYRSLQPKFKNSVNFERDYGVRFNILFSNVELLKSTIFTNLPTPDIRRRWSRKTDKDEVAQTLYRTVAEVSERASSWVFDTEKVKSKIEKIVKDYLIVGRGTVWVNYEPTIEVKADTTEELTDQKINIDYVYWQDFRDSWARTWQDVWWVARRHYLTKEDLKKQFEAKGSKVKLTKQTDNTNTNKSDVKNTHKDDRQLAEVWEIWDKDSKQVYFISEGLKDEFLDKRDFPIDLTTVFPLPKPLQNIETNDDNVPISDYRAYKEQAQELSIICERISILNKVLKWRYLYANQHSAKVGDFASLGDGEGLGVDISDIEAAGGLANVIFTMPLDELMKVILGLQQQKQALIQEIYEITGVADIMRSVSNPQETATAQKIKGQFGSFRLKKRQEAVQNYVRDLIRIITEIVCEHFTIDKLAEISGTDLPTEQEKAQLILQGQQGQIDKDLNDRLALPTWEQVKQILESDKLRSYTIDIESTATAFDEAQEDKQAVAEYSNGLMQMLVGILPQIMQMPEFLPIAKDLILLVVKSFKVGRTLEESLENSFNNLEQKLTQMQGQQGEGGEQAKAQTDMAKVQAQGQIAQMKVQADLQKEQMKLAAKAQTDAEKLRFEQSKLAFEQQSKQADTQLKAQDLERKEEKDLADVEIGQETVSIKQQEANRKDEELRVQAELKASELASQQAGQDVDINTNIAGDVGTLE